MPDPQDVTTGGEPIVRTSVRPQAEVSPPSVVTPAAGAGNDRGGSPAPAPFHCRQRRCATYGSIIVHPANHGVHRVTFHGELVGIYAPWDAALVVQGLHAGAHMESSRWRWTGAAGMEGEEP